MESPPPEPARVHREGDRIRRPTEFWSPSVHELLRYLEAVDFPASRLVRVEGGHEVLSWIKGESGPSGWARIVPEAGLRHWGRFLRRYHDAVADFRPAGDSRWAGGAGGCEPGEIVCHGDFGPWNAVWRDDQVVGLLDFDMARPAPPLFDVLYALEYAAPFRDDGECRRWLAYPEPPDRLRRIEIFCAAYGIAVPTDIGAQVAQQQRLVLEQCEALGRQGIEPQATWMREGHGETVRRRIAWTEALRLEGGIAPQDA